MLPGVCKGFYRVASLQSNAQHYLVCMWQVETHHSFQHCFMLLRAGRQSSSAMRQNLLQLPDEQQGKDCSPDTPHLCHLRLHGSLLVFKGNLQHSAPDSLHMARDEAESRESYPCSLLGSLLG